jgi:beta-barrel assembly-enhancing protease
MNHLKLLFVIVLPVLFTCTSVTNAVTDLIISDQDEIDMGAKFKAQIIADSATYPRYSKDTAVINYIEHMGQAIASAQHDRSGIPFSFTIIDDTVVNAFSLMGGPVFIYSGLLKKCNSGAEVAGVLAHEIGHITMRHGADLMAQQYGIQIINQILLGNDSSVTTTIAGLLENMAFLKFSRNDEYEADSCGVAFSVAAGYNPYGMENFFKTLYNLYGDTPFEIFSDHPSTSDRISNVQRLISKTSGAPAASDTTNFHIADFAAIKSKL